MMTCSVIKHKNKVRIFYDDDVDDDDDDNSLVYRFKDSVI